MTIFWLLSLFFFQLSPFPYDLVKAEIFKYPNAKLQWVQEDHKNMGGWVHVQPRIMTSISNNKEISYVGRAVSASPATGGKHQYAKEMDAFLSEAMALWLDKKEDKRMEGGSQEEKEEEQPATVLAEGFKMKKEEETEQKLSRFWSLFNKFFKSRWKKRSFLSLGAIKTFFWKKGGTNLR